MAQSIFRVAGAYASFMLRIVPETALKLWTGFQAVRGMLAPYSSKNEGLYSRYKVKQNDNIDNNCESLGSGM